MQNFSEEFKVKGEEVVEKVKQLIHEGNVRRLIIKDNLKIEVVRNEDPEKPEKKA